MKIQAHHFIDKHLPEAWIHEDSVLWIDQDEKVYATKGFVVHGQPMSNLSPEHLASWRAVSMAMLNSLEQSTHLDFHWTIENDYSAFLKGHAHGADPEAPNLAKHLMDERIADYKAQQVRNELRYRKLFVFVNFEPAPSKLSAGERVRRRFDARADHRMLLSEWKAARQKLEQVTNMVRHPFETSGMSTRLLDAKELRGIYRRMLSPHRSRMRAEEPQIQPMGRLWDETLHSDVERKGPWLFYDEHYHAFVSMTDLPQDTRAGFLGHLFNMSNPNYSINLTLRTTDKQKEIKNLQSDYGSKKGLQKAKERSGKVTNIAMETQAGEIEQEIRNLTQTPQQVFNVQMILHLFSPSEELLQSLVDDAILKVSYCHGAQAILEKIAAPEALRACLPGWTRESVLDRFQTVKSVNAADFIPAHTDFVGTGRPQLLFPTPEGGLMSAHIFTAHRPFHTVVVGESGGGKTFLLNSIVTQLVCQGLKSLTVISTKDEFGPLMSIYGGVKIAFTQDHPYFINPCAIAGESPTQDEINGMMALLETMSGEETNDTERRLRHSRLTRAADIAYKTHGSNTRLRHFLKILREGWEHNDRVALKKLAMLLEPYANGGHYGEYFDSDVRQPLDLSKNFKFFDFSRIKDDKNLCPIMMMALTSGESLRLAKLPRNLRKALILDECWAFVKTTAGGDFIDNSLRVNRAYNCAVFLSSQEAEDFFLSELEPVIKGNVWNYFLLRTKKTIQSMQTTLHLTDELAARFGVMPDPAEVGYSHFIYVHRGETSSIAGEALNRVSRPEGLLYSTSPNISQLRDHVILQAGDPWQAVCQLAELTPEQLKAETAKLFP